MLNADEDWTAVKNSPLLKLNSEKAETTEHWVWIYIANLKIVKRSFELQNFGGYSYKNPHQKQANCGKGPCDAEF